MQAQALARTDFDPLRRSLRGHLTDREYGAQCEREADRYREALQAINRLFAKPLVDGRAVKEIVSRALDERP